MNVGIGIGFFELLILAAVLVFGGLAVSSSRRSAVFLVVLGGAGLVLLAVVGAAMLTYVRTEVAREHVERAIAVEETNRSLRSAAEAAPSGAKPTPAPAAGSAKAVDPSRPEWVDRPDEFRDGAFHQVVHAGPFATPAECQTELTRLMRVAAQDYLATRSTAGDATADEAARTFDDEFLRRVVLRETWTETTEHSFGPMLTVHARLEFGPEILHELAERALAVRRGQRLGITGLVAAGVLGALTGAFALLKITTRA